MTTNIMRSLCCILFLTATTLGYACTGFLVGKKASVDGSVMISYNADSYGMYGRLIYLPAAKHAPGTMHRIVDGDTNHHLGEIPEADETYAVMGYINEHQLSIMESTWGGREELVNPTGIIDYVSLMRLGLQRAKTAREAIKIMTELADTYGYASSGESFSIADPNEVWIMEMVGRGASDKHTNWVAVRIPDDCISVHANQSRIHKFSQYDKKDVMYAKGMIDFARGKGYFTGKDAEFDFADAFNPADFFGMRACETRAWSFYNRFVEGMDKYIDYASGMHIGEPGIEPFPLFMKPKRLLSRQDLMAANRDHYEGTPFDVTKDVGMGPGEMPYRPSPLTFECNGKTYFNERPISTQQTADTYIATLRSWLPNAIGGVLWYGQDDPNMLSYVPIYCQLSEVPENFDAPDAGPTKFSINSSFWLCNWVSNMVYPRYNLLFPTLKTVRDELDSLFTVEQNRIEAEAMKIYANSPDSARMLVNNYSHSAAQIMHTNWLNLAEHLIVRFNDMVVKPMEKGEYKMTEDGLPVPPKRPGFSDSFKQVIVKQTDEKFLVPKK